jgi:hypothetical protein
MPCRDRTEDDMNPRVSWLAGLVVLAAGAAPALAQTGTPGPAPGSGTISKSNRTLGSGGTKTGAAGLNLTTPIPTAGGATTRTGTATTPGGSKGVAGGTMPGTGTGATLGSGSGVAGAFDGGGFQYGGIPFRARLTPEQEIALLAEARLLVTQLEGTGNLTLDRRESMLLTLLVYEALRQQAVLSPAGANGTTTPTTPTAPTTRP